MFQANRHETYLPTLAGHTGETRRRQRDFNRRPTGKRLTLSAQGSLTRDKRPSSLINIPMAHTILRHMFDPVKIAQALEMQTGNETARPWDEQAEQAYAEAQRIAHLIQNGNAQAPQGAPEQAPAPAKQLRKPRRSQLQLLMDSVSPQEQAIIARQVTGSKNKRN